MEILRRAKIICSLAEFEMVRLERALSRYEGWPDFNTNRFKSHLALWLSIYNKSRAGNVEFTPDEIVIIHNFWTGN